MNCRSVALAITNEVGNTNSVTTTIVKYLNKFISENGKLVYFTKSCVFETISLRKLSFQNLHCNVDGFVCEHFVVKNQAFLSVTEK